MNESKLHTAKSFGESLGVPKEAAYSFLRFLLDSGLARNKGTAPKDPAVKRKGKPESLYEISGDAPSKVAELISKAL